MSSDAKYPIREVARVTGVNPVTLRAWQRRYGLLKPTRTEKGHRLYSDEDISRIRTIQRWLERGIAIGKVKALLEQPDATQSVEQGDSWRDVIARLSEIVTQLDQGRFDAECNSLMSLYPFATLKQQLLLPLWWHFFPAQAELPLAGVLDSWLSARLLTRVTNANQHNNLPWIYLATAPGAARGLTLLEAAELSAAGYRVSLLGEIHSGQALMQMLSRLERLWLGAGRKPDTAFTRQLESLSPALWQRLGLLGPIWRSEAVVQQAAPERVVEDAEGLLRLLTQEAS